MLNELVFTRRNRKKETKENMLIQNTSAIAPPRDLLELHIVLGVSVHVVC